MILSVNLLIYNYLHDPIDFELSNFWINYEYIIFCIDRMRYIRIDIVIMKAK